MTDGVGASPLFDPVAWLRAWYGAPTATGAFVQPILPGWTFGNLVVNDTNSSAPATEAAIVARESYGRQLGKLMDAVFELIERQGGPDGVPAFQDLVKLRARIDGIKAATITDHLKVIEQDLTHLKAHDRDAYKAAVKTLRAMLPKE
ncbi:MAG TPA: hypothetical protein VJS38_09165 [Phenylobacterium sp.]|uniref:hypothetical protein n=1 Tax=Phenylobacterium sp. TaxID=1871053 RepID=UPI002B487CDF|nr:hypothetical protein [Phenylobacterium sp.]HKR88333.1 hypothetical protein [Phenylobacterium sp.]